MQYFVSVHGLAFPVHVRYCFVQGYTIAGAVNSREVAVIVVLRCKYPPVSWCTLHVQDCCHCQLFSESGFP